MFMKYLKRFEEYNDSKTEFTLHYKKISVIPTEFLPFDNNVTYIGVSNNSNLKKLPELPNNLELLSCYNNKLTVLPVLPKKLEELLCYKNILTSLPEIPKGLKILHCVNNKLTSLPELPDSLEQLYCYNNNWIVPIKYKYMVEFQLHAMSWGNGDINYVYTNQQAYKFKSFEFQKEFLEKNPSRYEDFIPFEYAKGIKELFPHIFSAHDLGL